jgi:capsular polysaccharide biosynthesis protein
VVAHWLGLHSRRRGRHRSELDSYPLYNSEGQFFISTRDSNTTAEVFQGSQFSEERVASYAQLLTGVEVAHRVAAELSLNLSPKDLAEETDATPVPNTVLLDYRVTDPSPQRAQAVAAEVAQQFTYWSQNWRHRKGKPRRCASA